MDDVLRQRLWRHLESLPDPQLYQVLDYIEFLSSKYAREPVPAAGSSVQRFGERLQDKMRTQGVGLRAMRGTFEAMGTADRLFAGLAEAGRSLLREVEQGLKPAPDSPADVPPRSLSPGPDQGPRDTRETRDLRID